MRIHCVPLLTPLSINIMYGIFLYTLQYDVINNKNEIALVILIIPLKGSLYSFEIHD